MSKLSITIDGQLFEVEAHVPANHSGTITVLVNGEPCTVQLGQAGAPEQIAWGGVNNRFYELELDHDLRWIRSAQGRHSLEISDQEAVVVRPTSRDGRIKAPIPGLIVRLLVEEGQAVETGQPVLVLEAMKMENEIRAPRAGILSTLIVKPGQAVKLHEVLAEIS